MEVFVSCEKSVWSSVLTYLANKLIKINEGANMKWHLQKGKYTNLAVNTSRREHYLTGIKYKIKILNIYVYRKIYISLHIYLPTYLVA